MFSKLFKILKQFGIYVAVISGVIAIYSFLETKLNQNNPAITVTKNSIEHLTMLPKAEGFRAQFIFKDSIVKDLWKIRFTIENTGKATIIGRGFQKSIIDSTLRLSITGGFSSISTSLVQSTFPLHLISFSDRLEFGFDQWRPGELAVFEMYVDGSTLQNRIKPNVLLNDRQLINGKSIYKEPSYASEDKKTYLKDLMPKFISNALWWFYILTSCIIFIAIPFALVDENKKRSKYKLWMSVYKSKYDEEVKELLNRGIVKKHYEPTELSEENWDLLVTPKVFVNAKPNISSMVIGIIAVLLFFLIPLLWMVSTF